MEPCLLDLQNLSRENCVFQSLSRVRLFATQTVARQAPPSMGFPKQGYGSGFPSPGDLPSPGMVPGSPASQADSSQPEPLREAINSFKKGSGKQDV